MNEEAMRKHYERTPKETLINILISSREEVEKLQKRNKERKQEIERLNNIINELNNAYCKVITKCEEIIDSRFYMNDIAIKKYADEIKDICKYYVGEAKELKGVDEE